MDIEKLRERLVVRDGLPTVKLTRDEYKTFRLCTPFNVWNSYAIAAMRCEARVPDLRAVVDGVGIVMDEGGNIEVGLYKIATVLP